MNLEMCTECARGASGKDGHRHLEELFRSNIRNDTLPQFITFHCTSCGAVWRRLGTPDRCAWSAQRR
jgi:hypothetical protein